MNKKVSMLSLVVLLSVLSCKDDDDPAYNFKDQDAQGEIASVPWHYEDGYAEDDGTNLNVTLMLEQADGSGCEVFQEEGDEVYFTVPNKVGLYKLDVNAETMQLVNMWEDDESFIHAAGDGAIEILSISSTEIKGRLDARMDSDHFINGNFTVSLCK